MQKLSRKRLFSRIVGEYGHCSEVLYVTAKPHSSAADLRTGGHWFDPRLDQYSFPGLSDGLFSPILTVLSSCLENFVIFIKWLISHCNKIHSSLNAVRSFNNSYVGKQQVAWKEYRAEYWLKELQESTDRCNGHCNITEILLKMLNTCQSNQPVRNQRSYRGFIYSGNEPVK